MNPRILLLLGCLSTVSAAFTQPGVLLSPEAEEVCHEMGRDYVTLTNHDIQVELGFDGICDEYLVFDVVLLNRTNDSLPFDPTGFHYLLLDSSTALSSGLDPKMALDPEEVIQFYEDALEEYHSDKEINSVFGVIESGVGIIVAVSAFLASENPGYIADAVFNTVGTAGSYLSRDRQINSEMEQIEGEKKVVEEEILRPGVIPPNMVASGFVYFPQSDRKDFMMVCIPVREELFQFVYRQQEIAE
jgi:hypothetical protein